MDTLTSKIDYYATYSCFIFPINIYNNVLNSSEQTDLLKRGACTEYLYACALLKIRKNYNNKPIEILLAPFCSALY